MSSPLLYHDSNKSDIKIVIMALLLAMVAPFTTDHYVPSLPAIRQALHTNVHAVQMTITLYLVGMSLSQLIYGPLSDSYGRRKIIILGLTLTVFSTALCALAPSISFLIIARLFQGAGAGVSNAILRAIMRDTFSGTRLAKIGSYIGMANTCILALAPIMGGHVQEWFGWQINFAMAVILCTAILLAQICYLPETLDTTHRIPIHPRIIWQNYLSVVKNKSFLCFAGCSSIAYGGFVTYYAISPFLLQDVIGLTPSQYGWLSLYIEGGLLLGLFANSRLLNHYAPEIILRFGIYLMILSGLALLLSVIVTGTITVTLVMAPSVLFTIASGLVFSNAMVSAFHTFAHIAGSAAALYGSIQIFGSVLITILIAHLPVHNRFLLGIMYFVLGLIAQLLLTRVPKQKNLSPL